MMDDALNMELKGVDNMNMLQHTDFFIWADGIEPTQIDKVTATPDVLPTVANLLGLDTTGAFLVGHDGLGDQGGGLTASATGPAPAARPAMPSVPPRSTA